MKNYDYIFVLNDIFCTKYPSGGSNIIYHLASHLTSKGYKVAIFSIEINPPKRLIRSLPKLVFPNNSVLKMFMKLRRSDYNYGLLKNVDILFNSHFSTKNIVACSWQTAGFVNRYVIENQPNVNGYIFIQNFEDDNLFSGEQAIKAREAYSYKSLKKIVICEGLQKKYTISKTKPLRMQVYVDDFFKCETEQKDRERYTVLIPLRREESKGSKYAIDACSYLDENYSNYPFRFIGYGNKKAIYIPEFIDYYYKPTNKELIELYNEASIFIDSSLIEGFGSSSSQAMACGCVPVISNSIGVNEYAKDGYNSLIVPIKDSEALAKGVIKLARNNKLRYTLAKNGIKTIKEGFTLEQMYSSFDKALGIR